jgi:hypothetical protein
MLRRARRSLPRRAQVYGPHLIAFHSPKPTVVEPLDRSVPVRNREPGAPGSLELGHGTNA